MPELQRPTDDVETDNQENQETDASDEGDDKIPGQLTNAQIASYFKTRLEGVKRFKNDKQNDWRLNVERRMGYVGQLYTGGLGIQDELQSEINPDWYLTKAKTANLYSQVPTVRLAKESKQFFPALAPFAKALNFEIGQKRARVGVAMEEHLNDVVNAAGFGAIYVGYEATFNTKLGPAIDPNLIPPDVRAQLTETDMEIGEEESPDPKKIEEMLLNMQMPMRMISEPVDSRIFTRRICPNDALFPADFTGSDFDDGDFVGFTGRCPWSTGKDEFKLTEEDYQQVITNANEKQEDSLRVSAEQKTTSDTKYMKYDRIFYWRSRVDPTEKHLDCIWEIVWVHGLNKPSVHRPWKGQKLVGRGYIGNRKFPVRFTTLTYVSDNPIPPSDTQVGRPQVDDMRRSRRDMFANRERSIPIRWFDVNRIDQSIQELLMRGTWQGMIPTNGDGSRSIGEIARASYPSENLTFDQQAKADLMETWAMGPNQVGTSDSNEESATGAKITQQNFTTRMGQERGRVQQTFISIAEQIAGWMVLTSDFPTLTDQERQAMQQAWNMGSVVQDLVFTILPDSQIVLDSNQRIEKLGKFLNLTVKSGYVNPKPIIEEMAELSGIDPVDVVVDPQPQKEDPNISYRFSGKDDLYNPIVAAMLMIKGDFPNEDQIEKAKQLLLKAQDAAIPAPPPQPGPGGPNPTPEPSPSGPGGGPVPADPTHEEHPNWQLGSRIMKRSRDANG